MTKIFYRTRNRREPPYVGQRVPIEPQSIITLNNELLEAITSNSERVLKAKTPPVTAFVQPWPTAGQYGKTKQEQKI